MKRCMLGLVGIGTMLALVLTGCEEGTSRALSISPSFALLQGGSNTVTFVVTTNTTQALSLPLEWSVVNPALGSIVARAGYGATYAANGNPGDNVIVVRDQYGAEGMATVRKQ